MAKKPAAGIMAAGIMAAAITLIVAQTAFARTMLPDGPLLRGEVVLSGDWAFACNNRGLCTGIGVPDARPALDARLATLPPIVVRIALRSRPMPGKVAWLHLPAGFDNLSGVKLGVRAGLGPTGPSGPIGLLIPREQVDGLFQDFDTSAPHIVHDAQTGEAVARMPQHGFRGGYAAVQRVHAQYGTASPNAADPAIRPDNVVSMSVPGPLHSVTLPSVTTASCSGSGARVLARIYPLSDGTRLWQYICAGKDSEAGPNLLFSQKNAHAPLIPLILPDPAGRPIDAGQVWLREVNLTSGILLSSAAYAGPGRDCGKYWIWALTHEGFRLIAKREMPKCGTGLPEGLWLDTYDASFLDDLDSLQNDEIGN